MKKTFLTIGVALALLSTSSCDKEFLDVNEDPNNPVVAPVEYVLPAAITSTASAVGGEYAILGGIWSQYYTQNNGSSQYISIDQFNIQPTSFNNRWTEQYAGALNDYRFVKEKAAAAKEWNAYLMATVMEAYNYQVLVDLYDRIPFDEAGQGETKQNLSPAFRDGQAVYDSLVVRIDKALALPVSGGVDAKLGKGDVVFNGDMQQWVRFANTLKLKIYMRQVYARPQVAEAGIKALYASGAEFLDEAADMAIFTDATSKRNPLYEMDQTTALNSNQNLKASNTFFSFLQVNNDPRLDKVYLPGSGGQKAMVQGTSGISTSQLVPATVSRALILPTAPVYFISEAESYFLQAEAALRGFGTGDAAALYSKGVDAAFEQIGSERMNLYPYPANGSFEDRLETIIVQKWASFAGTYQGLEAFLERNRTGYPETSEVAATNAAYQPGEFTYPVEGITSGKLFPTRLPWPQDEVQRNPNAPQTPEPITKPVWWDVK
ncbi:SusD-like starch-binding protein associating with outer membrane [Pontibacter ummariensis]|uniref:Starch-binding associating with outer membrane n=1 Tax=Pontibacter ummariensis TaxID=1610492 RepID=A0A239IY47_9BACT|nr:SusD/RagB family nutrient-binding outer membrane lipoprotein [Pontibacter ummariensis]PRY08996.1 SusD-like starch-binding protein associating with outer membrane [Pontibacter ummariensis]SNS97943.1 Starch-binding associating with outer membrane [Pontibacter ummariensis]